MILVSLTILPAGTLAYDSNICLSSKCVASEVGPFMQGITSTCGNSGNCTLEDMMVVVANVGNWVLGIIGAVVLLMYTIGGIYMLSSGGNPGRVQTGKDYIKISTMGLIIVFVGYLGITTMSNVLTTSTGTPGVDAITPAQCAKGGFEGASCGTNKVCRDKQCMGACEAQFYNPPDVLTKGVCISFDPEEVGGVGGVKDEFTHGCLPSGVLCGGTDMCCPSDKVSSGQPF